MQTRQELILDFMKAMAGTGDTTRVAIEEYTEEQQRYAKEIYLMAALFADEVLSRS